MNRLVDLAAGTQLDHRPFAFDNGLADHPLFEDERLVKMLQRMPRQHVEIRYVPTVEEQKAYFRAPLVTDRDPVEVFRQLPERPAWMLIHKLKDHDPDYEALRRSMLRQARERLTEFEPEVDPIGCMMFLSSGSVVVHFHADPDTTFLNQVRGKKTVYTYPAAILEEAAIEELADTHDQSAVVYRPEFEDKAFEPIQLTPGKSVFLPHYAPHRVTNDDEMCVSFNIGFRPRANRRRRRVHIFNRRLRKLGVPIRGFGKNPLLDSAKELCHFGLTATERAWSLARRVRSADR